MNVTTCHQTQNQLTEQWNKRYKNQSLIVWVISSLFGWLSGCVSVSNRIASSFKRPTLLHIYLLYNIFIVIIAMIYKNKSEILPMHILCQMLHVCKEYLPIHSPCSCGHFWPNVGKYSILGMNHIIISTSERWCSLKTFVAVVKKKQLTCQCYLEPEHLELYTLDSSKLTWQLKMGQLKMTFPFENEDVSLLWLVYWRVLPSTIPSLPVIPARVWSG